MKKNECSDEQVIEVLTRVQRIRMYDKGKDKSINWFLVSEDRDWVIIMQWMQDNDVFWSRPERPPFKEFADWMESIQVPQLLTECNAVTLSRAYCKLGGERYPWKSASVQKHILFRWRVLYQMLDKMLTELP